MKYTKYILILLLSTLVGIISIVWYWLIRDYRATARNVVYNYILKNKIQLWQLSRYVPNNKFDGYITDVGLVKFNDVSYIKYLWWKWVVWIWLDDNCENDTFNINVITKKSWYETSKKYFGKILLDNTLGYKLYGTAFTLGDKRNDEPAISFINEVHHLYTSSTNFDHYYGYTSITKYLFNLTILGRVFGWIYFDTIDDVDIYKLVFNKKKY